MPDHISAHDAWLMCGVHRTAGKVLVTQQRRCMADGFYLCMISNILMLLAGFHRCSDHFAIAHDDGANRTFTLCLRLFADLNALPHELFMIHVANVRGDYRIYRISSILYDHMEAYSPDRWHVAIICTPSIYTGKTEAAAKNINVIRK